MRYLLDTNIISDLVRNPKGQVAQRIHALGEAQVCTSIIVAAELRYRVSKSRSLRLKAQLDKILGSIEVLRFEAPADAIYGDLCARLERKGRQIGGNDLLIAAHAMALGHIIVTDNEREFARIDDLPRENWLRMA